MNAFHPRQWRKRDTATIKSCHLNRGIDLREIKTSVSIASLISESLSLRRNGKTWTALCPFHGERTPSFTVYANGWYCFGCGAHGDVIDWLMKARRMSFHDAVTYLSSRNSSQSAMEPISRPASPDREAVTTDSFMRVWCEGRDPSGTPVETYLLSRGHLTLPPDAPIRFHPRCQRGPRNLQGGPEHWPAMLTLMTDAASGEPVGLHRTYLRPGEAEKAPITKRLTAQGEEILLTSKRILGTWGVVRLAPDHEVGRALAVTEGIENALTAAQVIGWGPVWAAGTQDCIRKFPVLDWIEALNIFADADDSGTGLAAARACAERWRASGRECLVHVPPAGCDWNDAVRRVEA